MTSGGRAGISGSLFRKKLSLDSCELPQCGPQYFSGKIPGPGSEDVRTRVEDDLVKVVCGGTVLSMPAYSATCTDPHTQSVLSNQSVVPLSMLAEDTE